jgi:AcrR family transcriptional regulator
MDDIAHDQGISKKTIYQYFDDKNDLVRQVTLMLIEEWMKEYEGIIEKAIDAIDELYSKSKLISKLFSELNPSFMFDLRKYYPRSWDLFLKHENEVVFHSVVDNLERGIREGYFRSDINVRVLAKIRLDQIHVTVDERLFQKEQFDFTELRIQLFDHYIHGLLTESGRELYMNYQKKNDE